MSAVSSSPIPAVLAKLGPLSPDDAADLRIYLEGVPDPRSRRGRWYSLTSILLVCAAAAVSGARTVDELAEWGARADSGLLAAFGVCRHLLNWRHAPSRSAIGRVLERLDADALDAAVGAWLARRHTAATPAGEGRGRRVIAVDGKALRGSAHLDQPTAWAQLDALDWNAVKVQHTASHTGRGRRESRSIKTLAIADNLGGIAFPHARLAIRLHRRRKPTGAKETRESVYAVTSLDAHQTNTADLSSHLRGHWTVEAQHHIRDRVFAEDASTVHTGSTPRAMATLRNLAIGALKTRGVTNIAKTTRAIRDQPERALPILGITTKPDAQGT